MDTVTAPTSISVKLAPLDHRCKYWCKIVRAAVALPLPSIVEGADNIPGTYKRGGDEELFPGDMMFEGEAKHHKKERGWMYHLTCIYKGKERCIKASAEIKTRIKSRGLDVNLLAGSGDLAGIVRIAHAIRAGIEVDA